MWDRISRTPYNAVWALCMQAVVNHAQYPAYKDAEHRAVVNHEQDLCALLSTQHGLEEEERCPL